MRRTSIPWMVVAAGAAVYWYVALGVGIPTLGRALGVERHRHRARPLAGCVASTTVDGRAVAFGDCITVRFMHDSPDIPRPVQFQRAGFVVPDLVDEPLAQPTPDEKDSIGRTAY